MNLSNDIPQVVMGDDAPTLQQAQKFPSSLEPSLEVERGLNLKSPYKEKNSLNAY